jgi:plastocyanin
MDGDIFYVVGILLVIAALVLSYFGVRGADSFPPSRAILVGVTGLFAAIVVVTAAFAVDLSEEEQAHREAELAHEEEQAQAETGGEAVPATPGGQPQASEGGNQQPPTTTATAQTLDVTSPASGALVFEPNGLEAQPGSLTIDYTNPSSVPHSIAVATANGNVLGETQPGTNDEQTLQIPQLAPGKFIFYCTVPGHREAGMEGDLTVSGGPTP